MKVSVFKKKSTLVLAVITLILLILTGAVAYLSYNADNSGKIAYIYKRDELLYTIDLNAVDEPYTIEIAQDDGCVNVIGVEKGSIAMLSADCPDKICVNTGAIGNGIMPIVCVPNGVMIVVRDEEAELDAGV